jgi:hypothetical protein
MWNKLSFIFVTIITSSIPSVHFCSYLFTLYTSPFICSFYDIVFLGESIDNISELFVKNHINVILGNLSVEDRALWISTYKVLSLIISVVLGLIYAQTITIWLFSF